MSATPVPHGTFICATNHEGKRWSYTFDSAAGTLSCSLVDSGLAGWSATYRKGVMSAGEGGTVICEATVEWGNSDEGVEAERPSSVLRIFETVLLEGRVKCITDPEHTMTFTLEELDRA